MTKRIFKEVVIVLLILLAIILTLGILFYDYIPNNKTVPIKIQAYDMPEDIKEELKEAIPDEQSIVRTYYIDSDDLSTYESTNDYDKGKANPFAAYDANVQNNSSNSTVNKNNSATNSNVADNKQDVNESKTNENEAYITTPGKNY